MQVSTNISGLSSPLTEETVTVGVAAVTVLTTAKWQQRGSELIRDQGNARFAILTIEGRIRYWFSGTAPTGAIGHIGNDGDTITLASESQFKNFKAIREIAETSDATIRISYFR